jgi:hypothetical protein
MTRSVKDVRGMFENVKNAVIDAGYSRTVTNGSLPGEAVTQTLTGADLVLEEGSQTYGRAWRLFLVGPYGAHYTFEHEYLGWTREEAYLSLRGILSGLRMGGGGGA